MIHKFYKSIYKLINWRKARELKRESEYAARVESGLDFSPLGSGYLRHQAYARLQEFIDRDVQLIAGLQSTNIGFQTVNYYCQMCGSPIYTRYDYLCPSCNSGLQGVQGIYHKNPDNT